MAPAEKRMPPLRVTVSRELPRDVIDLRDAGSEARGAYEVSESEEQSGVAVFVVAVFLGDEGLEQVSRMRVTIAAASSGASTSSSGGKVRTVSSSGSSGERRQRAAGEVGARAGIDAARTCERPIHGRALAHATDSARASTRSPSPRPKAGRLAQRRCVRLLDRRR
jgi:hypothetical protein